VIWQRTTRDRERLAGVHPDLVRVVEAACAAGAPRFMVLEGLRTLERQRHLLQPASRPGTGRTTIRSRRS
jgi:peptidoglycan L-alanyl-D-glutamate endopeptidase CwlK